MIDGAAAVTEPGPVPVPVPGPVPVAEDAFLQIHARGVVRAAWPGDSSIYNQISMMPVNSKMGMSDAFATLLQVSANIEAHILQTSGGHLRDLAELLREWHSHIESCLQNPTAPNSDGMKLVSQLHALFAQLFLHTLSKSVAIVGTNALRECFEITRVFFYLRDVAPAGPLLLHEDEVFLAAMIRKCCATESWALASNSTDIIEGIELACLKCVLLSGWMDLEEVTMAALGALSPSPPLPDASFLTHVVVGGRLPMVAFSSYWSHALALLGGSRTSDRLAISSTTSLCGASMPGAAGLIELRRCGSHPSFHTPSARLTGLAHDIRLYR